MSWINRITEAAYTSPSGKRTVFIYEDVSQNVDKKTSVFTFPDADGSYIQDLGHTGHQYPLRLFFSGADYDLEADEFEKTLLEKGIGKLEHPKYGVINVVPFGSISREDRLVTGANQAVFDITFFETITIIYPTNQADPGSNVVSSVNDYNTALATEFEQVTDLDSTVNQATFKSDYQALLDTTTEALKSIADTEDSVRDEFNEVNDSINNGIDILVGKPLTLAFQTAILIQAPSRAVSAITDRLNAYSNLLNNIITGDKAIQVPSISANTSNKYHTNNLYVSTYVTGSILSVVNNTFQTKNEAINAAEEITNQFDAHNEWRDDNLTSLNIIDIGSSYQQLQEAYAVAIGFLVEISFTLKSERKVILSKDSTVLELVAEFYGEIDNQIDFFIDSNNLSGSEILEIKAGREIAYYV